MQYKIHFGKLQNAENGQILAGIRKEFLGKKRVVLLYHNGVRYQTNISVNHTTVEENGDVRFRTYMLYNNLGEVIMEAHPSYMKGDEPDIFGWPVCRMPKVDHADVLIHGIPHILIMHNNKNYYLQNEKKNQVLQIVRKSFLDIWEIDSIKGFQPELICGIVIFCRYLEQENQLITV